MCLRDTTKNLGSITSGLLQASGVFPTYPESQTVKPTELFLTRASPLDPSSLRPLPRPLSPSLIMPPALQQPSALASPLQKRISPRPTALRKNRERVAAGVGWASPAGARHSHHRGRWLGRKAEVRKWTGPRRLPFRSKRSRSLLPDFRTLSSVLRVGEGKPCKTWSFVSFPARLVLIFFNFKFQIGTQASPVIHASFAFYFEFLLLFVAFFPHSYAMVQPGRRLGTIFGQDEAEETFVPSGSAPLSFLRAPPTASPRGSAGLTA